MQKWFVAVEKYFSITILAVMLVVMVTPLSASAYAGGLLNGKTFNVGTSHNSVSYTTALVTDNNEATSVTLNKDADSTAWYSFDTPVNIESMRIKVGNSGAAIQVEYYNNANAKIGQSAAYSSINSRQDVKVKGVKKIGIRNTSGTSHELFEFDVWGATVTGEIQLVPVNTPIYNENGTFSLQAAESLIADGNDTSASYFAKGLYFKVNLDDPTEIRRITTRIGVGNNVKDAIRYDFYSDIAQTQLISSYTPTTAANFENKTGLSVKGVKSIKATSITAGTLNEVKIYGIPTVPTPPPVPTGLNGIAFDGSTKLTWNAVTDADLRGYNVYVNGIKITATPITTTSYTAAVSNNIVNTFHVTSINNSGVESEKSDPVTSIFDTISPISPVGLTSNPTGDGSTLLEWTPNTEPRLAGYNVYVNDAKRNGSLVIPPQYLVTDLATDTLYSFTVTAVNTSNIESPKSEAVTYYIDTTPPAIPTGLTATAGNGEISLGWNQNTELDFAGYNLYRNGTKINGNLLTGTTYIDQGLTNGTEYSYQLSAVDQIGNESGKTAVVKAKPYEPFVATPAGVFAVGAKDKVTFRWEPVPNATEYRIYRDGALIGSVAAPPYIDTNITSGTVYNYQVTAVEGNDESTKSFPPSRAQPGAGIPIDPGGGGVIGGGSGGSGMKDIVGTGFGFVGKFGPYIAVILAILFAPTILSFISWMLKGFPKSRPTAKGKGKRGKSGVTKRSREPKQTPGGKEYRDRPHRDDVTLDTRLNKLMFEGRTAEHRELMNRYGGQIDRQVRERYEARNASEKKREELQKRHRSERASLANEVREQNRTEREARAGRSGRGQRRGR